LDLAVALSDAHRALAAYRLLQHPAPGGLGLGREAFDDLSRPLMPSTQRFFLSSCASEYLGNLAICFSRLPVNRQYSDKTRNEWHYARDSSIFS
jgi:hypothetical protein